MIESLNINFQSILKIFTNVVIFNYLMAQWSAMTLEMSRKIERIEIFSYLDQKQQENN